MLPGLFFNMITIQEEMLLKKKKKSSFKIT